MLGKGRKVRRQGGTFFLWVLLFIGCLGRSAWAGDLFTIELGGQGGYRLDRLDWNIAGNSQGSSPNILSELTWHNVRSAYVLGHGKLTLARENWGGLAPCLFSRLGYGQIFSGENQDSDYNQDNRQGEFSRSNNSADNGSLFDFSVGLGASFFIDDDKFRLTPQFGYSYHKQNLTLHDGWQTIPASGAFAGLDSSYKAEWEGPWLGLETSIQPSATVELSLRMAYHFALSYWAEGHWNLRSDLLADSYHQKATDGHGYSVAVGGSYLFHPGWDLYGQVEYHSFTISDGSDWKYFTSGAISQTRLNEVNWSARLFSGGIRFSF